MLKCRYGSQAGYSYVEMMVTAAVLVVLASMAVPMYQWDQKRRKEVHLRAYLQQIRGAIDRYKAYTDEGRILLEDVDQMGYPPDFETLVEGVTVSQPVLSGAGTGQQGQVGQANRPGQAGPAGQAGQLGGTGNRSRNNDNDDAFGESAEGQLIRFLLREPIDPITGEPGWGMRSYQDDWDTDSWGSENLYDVYSLSEKKALNGTYYRDW
jgi:general secretion pathway protein G